MRDSSVKFYETSYGFRPPSTTNSVRKPSDNSGKSTDNSEGFQKRKYQIIMIIIVCILSIIIIGLIIWDTKFKSSRARPKIVFGRKANPKEFPYNVFLSYNGLRFVDCGGSILNVDWVITAAHCIDNNTLYVYAGTNYVKKSSEHDQVRLVDKKYVHEKYKLLDSKNDISLLHVNKSFVFNDYVRPVLLPDKDMNVLGKCIVAGWGNMAYNCTITHPEEMRTTIIEIHNQAGTWLVTKATDDDHVNDSCQGDSGSGLVKKNANGDYVIIGIVSFGPYPCGSNSAPSYYTRVQLYLDWIKKIQEKHKKGKKSESEDD